MKIILLVALTLSMANLKVLAGHPGSGPGDSKEMFGKRKLELVSDLEAKITDLQNAKSCASAAQDEPAMQKCHQEMRKAHQEAEARMKTKRKEHIDEQIKHLQAEKEKMEKTK